MLLNAFGFYASGFITVPERELFRIGRGFVKSAQSFSVRCWSYVVVVPAEYKIQGKEWTPSSRAQTLEVYMRFFDELLFMIF